MNVLVLSDNDLLAEQIILCLKRRRARVTITGVEVSSHLQSAFYCDRFVKIDRNDASCLSDILLDSIEKTCEKYWIDAIIPAGTGATLALANIASRIKCAGAIPLPDCDTFSKLNSKIEFANFLNSQELPHPQTSPIPSALDLERCMLVPPVIVKPANGEGNLGIEVALDSERLEGAKVRLLTRSDYPLIAQEYISGPDIDLSLLAIDGDLTDWTIQERVSDQKIRFSSNETVLELGRKIVKSANYTGVAHIDMRFDARNGSVSVIEFNPRFWFTVGASEAAGVNFPYIASCHAAGKPMPQIKYAEGVAWFMNGWQFASA